METKFGFMKMTATEFASYFADMKIARTVLRIQQHHTYIPSYIHFNGNNCFELQKSMKDTHVNVNGWMDIGQHLTIFPDGFVLTGRSFEQSPAGIYGSNADAFCIENLGNFDIGLDSDEMTAKQKEAIITVTAALCRKFGLTPNTNNIVYHHWFNLSTGSRNNGAGGNKSCPGTNFCGGNTVEDCERSFIPLVYEKFKSYVSNEESVIKYVSVTADFLNIRSGPSISYPEVADRNPALFGAILRVYEEKNNWYRISSSSPCWVSAPYTKEVKRALVKADALHVRSGAGTSFPIIGSLTQGTEVFVYNREAGWSQISIESEWVSDTFLNY